MAAQRWFACSTEQVWDVLSDGWLYPLWVVGASRIRDVDDGWPAEGRELHHSFGVWPLVIDDTTEPSTLSSTLLIVLEARGWPCRHGAGGDHGAATWQWLTGLDRRGRLQRSRVAGSAAVREAAMDTQQRNAAPPRLPAEGRADGSPNS
jgi:hypothetical protein